jgi:hypothetical protein
LPGDAGQDGARYPQMPGPARYRAQQYPLAGLGDGADVGEFGLAPIPQSGSDQACDGSVDANDGGVDAPVLE